MRNPPHPGQWDPGGRIAGPGQRGRPGARLPGEGGAGPGLAGSRPGAYFVEFEKAISSDSSNGHPVLVP